MKEVWELKPASKMLSTNSISVFFVFDKHFFKVLKVRNPFKRVLMIIRGTNLHIFKESLN